MKREIKWDLLRAISCISVILLHVAALYTEEPAVYQTISAFGFSACDFLQIMTRTAVPCFVMLSGAFLLEKSHLDVVAFYRQSIRKQVIPTIVVGMGYMGIKIIMGGSFLTVLLDALYGKPAGHLWFMFMLMGLYGVFPFLYFFKQNVSKQVFQWFSFGMVFLSCVIHFTCELIWPVQFLEYLGYFLMGDYIRKNGKSFRGNAALYLLMSVVFLIITFLLNEWQFFYGIYNAPFFRNPNFPTVIIASLAIFIAFSKLEFVSVPNGFLKIARHSLMMYMLHPFVINVINKIVKHFLSGKLPNPMLYVPLLFVVCMVGSYTLALFADNVVNKYCWPNTKN